MKNLRLLMAALAITIGVGGAIASTHKSAKAAYATRYYSVRTTGTNYIWQTADPQDDGKTCGAPTSAYCFIDSNVVPTNNSVPAPSQLTGHGAEGSFQ